MQEDNKISKIYKFAFLVPAKLEALAIALILMLIHHIINISYNKKK